MARGRIFAKRSLDGIVEPTHVDVSATVVTDDVTVSPITFVRAAWLRWSFLEGGAAGGSGGGARSGVALRPRVSGVLGPTQSLRIGSHTIEVDAEATVLDLGQDPGEGVPLTTTVPEPLRSALAATTFAGEIYYSETYVLRGDVLRLRAVVVPVAGGGGYRAQQRVDFAVRPDLGKVRLSSG